MALLQPRWIIGKTVASVEMNPFPDNKGGTAYDPVIRFSDGSWLHFVVQETETSEYGVEPIYVKARRAPRG